MSLSFMQVLSSVKRSSKVNGTQFGGVDAVDGAVTLGSMNGIASQAAWPSMPAATRSVLLEVLVHGPLPRAEIASRLGLSKTSLTRITRSLIADGLFVEGATELRVPLGRPSELLHLATGRHHFIGIKLTGDHLYAAVTDLSARVVASRDEPLGSTRVGDVVEQIAGVVASYREEFPTLVSIGVALAGTIHRERGEQIVMESYFLGWDRVPLARLVSETTGLPTATENDVQALTATEHWFGAGAGLHSFVLITVGAGIGCGMVVNDRLVEGARGLPGHVSHVVIDPTGPTCARGHHGCATVYLTSESIATALPPDAEGRQTYESALARAGNGDEDALRVFAAAGLALGTLIGLASTLLDPQKVILTGDGLPLYGIAAASVEDGIRASRDSDLGPLDLDVQAFDFGEWARAGAVLAIRTVMAG
jgi:predicted NBD/HSP70 family sugar kinase